MPTAPEDTIHAIASTRRYTDRDNRRVEDVEIEQEEGWFASPQAARARVDQLNRALHRAHELDEDRRTREREAQRDSARQTNKEAAAIRAAGMPKADVKVPDPYRRRGFEQWAASKDSLTTHHVIALTRSEHDAILAAAAQQQQEGPS